MKSLNLISGVNSLNNSIRERLPENFKKFMGATALSVSLLVTPVANATPNQVHQQSGLAEVNIADSIHNIEIAFGGEINPRLLERLIDDRAEMGPQAVLNFMLELTGGKIEVLSVKKIAKYLEKNGAPTIAKSLKMNPNDTMELLEQLNLSLFDEERFKEFLNGKTIKDEAVLAALN